MMKKPTPCRNCGKNINPVNYWCENINGLETDIKFCTKRCATEFKKREMK